MEYVICWILVLAVLAMWKRWAGVLFVLGTALFLGFVGTKPIGEVRKLKTDAVAGVSSASTAVKRGVDALAE